MKQWLISNLLGAVNIEQTKLLDFDSLKLILGTIIPNIHTQRQALHGLANSENIRILQNYNAQFLNAANERDFYFDPHCKHYTGIEKVLKSWFSNTRSIGKVMHMDFFHTLDGYPLFVKHADNFYDMRERFTNEIIDFRQVLAIPANQNLTYFIDRGIYKMELFEQFQNTNTRIVTWEKGYKKSQWNDSELSGEFVMTRCRNNVNDLLLYHFRYIEKLWPKNEIMRNIIVQATNPKNRMVEVSILTHDQKRPAQEIIQPMFNRWVQENDFKYLGDHFGINEITSYSSIAYTKLKNIVNDRQIKSGLYKGLEKEKQKLVNKLKKLLISEQLSQKKDKKRQDKIKQLNQELEILKDVMKTTEKEESRLDALIKNQNVRLNTTCKSFMDNLKIIARNMFYKMFQPFKKSYNNFRDDHVIFRNLINSHGLASFGENCVDIILFPTMRYQPKIRRIVEEQLHTINDTNPIMPDGSNRRIFFSIE